MGAPGFWDDQQQAARISTEHSRVTRRLDRYHRLNGEVEEARELYELDPSLEDDLRTQLMPVSTELSRLRLPHRFRLVYGGHNWALWRSNARVAYLTAATRLAHG